MNGEDITHVDIYLRSGVHLEWKAKREAFNLWAVIKAIRADGHLLLEKAYVNGADIMCIVQDDAVDIRKTRLENS